VNSAAQLTRRILFDPAQAIRIKGLAHFGDGVVLARNSRLSVTTGR
jgi:hypothetical protein